MIQEYSHTITKEEIATMPLESFEGRIITVNTEKEADMAVEYLKKYKVVGFDTETRPSFKKGKRYIISWIQISTPDTCFLFRLNYIDMPESLEQYLRDEQYIKIGLSLRDDFKAIQNRSETDLNGFLDLQKLVVDFSIEEASLQKIYAIIFGKKISKGQRLTNWEAETLSEAQKKYAALDAWACLKIYYHLIYNQELTI